jgi:hypothetical protein
MNTSARTESLPRRIILSLQVGGFFFALANVICVAILAHAYLEVRHAPTTLEVKGSAKREITSDTIDWSGTITTRDPDLVTAYNKLKTDSDRVAAFIRNAGIPDAEVTFSAIDTNKIYQREVVRGLVKNGDGDDNNGKQEVSKGPEIVPTQKVEQYELTQTISIESRDMDKVPALARSVTSLIKDGVEIESDSPRYLYSKLSELKIDMLGEATRDATLRATQIVNNANGQLGRLVDAKMGVMQINPKGVTDVSDTGNNDTTSLDLQHARGIT